MEGVRDSMWEAVEPSTSGLPDSEPAGRCGHVAFASRDGQSLFVIGGYNPEGVLSDMWEFHLERREWDRVNITAGPSPPERAYFQGCTGPPPASVEQQHLPREEGGGEEGQSEPVFAYIFGGTDAEGNAANDVWCLDVERRRWHEAHRGHGQGHHSASVPCARSNHSMCRMGTVLAVHGGESASGDLLDDLWFFHPASASWRKDGDVSPATAGPRPCPRSSHCLALAERSGDGSADGSSGLVLFGGLGYAETQGGGVISDDEEEEDTMPLNDLWVWYPASGGGGGGGNGSPAAVAASSAAFHGTGGGEGAPSSGGGVWSLVLLDGVGPSPRSLAAAVPAPRRPNCGGGGNDSSVADLFLFGGYGLVELGGTADDGGSEEEQEDEGGEIIMAYIDDLWRLTLGIGGTATANGTSSVDGGGGAAVPLGWANEADMGFAGESIVEGRNGHTLTWCGDKLVLFGGFVGDGFDAGVHVAEPPCSPLD
ncbi:unnamed protein product [Scytosiphon promiscuus]